ncbi:rhodanese-like domain-containing protein [Candidatus Bathyarchaeota archaeon]|nr:rhodanese-like domain-containing protein [Candidatus Bathyarchaeota archaeon]
MSETEDIFRILRENWKILVRWILGIHGIPEVTVDELRKRMDSNDPPILIDIRFEDDFYGRGESKYGHIPGAKHIPFLKLEDSLEDLDPNKEIVTMCPGGGLSLAAVEVLNEAGFKNVKSLKGGTDAWHKKGYPLTIE